MSLDKAITHGKEKRKPYRGAKAIDATCRNHGSDEWHEGNRRYKMRDKLTDVNESNYQCATCKWEPPSVFGGKPCFHCEPNDPLMSCYEPKGGTGERARTISAHSVNDEREVLTMAKPILKPCPCCGVSRSVNFAEIQRLFSWEITLFCPHRGCNFEATGRGATRHGAERRAIKRWNEKARGGADE